MRHADELFNQVINDTGYNRNQLRGRLRVAGLVSARRNFINLALQEGYSLAAIGRHLNRDHTTILHHVQKFRLIK